MIQQHTRSNFTLNEREYQTVSIWMIRHGQSQSNAGLATIGPHENALSELGDRQSRCIPSAVKQTPDLIVTSPYLRTQLTAQPLIEQFPHTPVEAWQVQEFTYLGLQLDQPTTTQATKARSQSLLGPLRP